MKKFVTMFCLTLVFAIGVQAQENGWTISTSGSDLVFGQSTRSDKGKACIIYIDTNPSTTFPELGTNSVGSLSGFVSYDGWQPTLPFRADFVMYFHSGYAEYRRANGSGGWDISPTTSGFTSSGGTSVTIPWNTVRGGPTDGGTGAASRYLYLASCVKSDNSAMDFMIPSLNPSNKTTNVVHNAFWENGKANASTAVESGETFTFGGATLYNAYNNGGTYQFSATQTIKNNFITKGTVESTVNGAWLVMDTGSTLDLQAGANMVFNCANYLCGNTSNNRHIQYNTGSTLKYSSGGTFVMKGEWYTKAKATITWSHSNRLNTPWNVWVTNNTKLTWESSEARLVRSVLTIDAGSELMLPTRAPGATGGCKSVDDMNLDVIQGIVLNGKITVEATRCDGSATASNLHVVYLGYGNAASSGAEYYSTLTEPAYISGTPQAAIPNLFIDSSSFDNSGNPRSNGGVVLKSTQTISSSLNLCNGLVTIGNNDLIMSGTKNDVYGGTNYHEAGIGDCATNGFDGKLKSVATGDNANNGVVDYTASNYDNRVVIKDKAGNYTDGKDRSWVVTNGTGYLIRAIRTTTTTGVAVGANDILFFPIGPSSTRYNPATLTNITSGQMKARVDASLTGGDQGASVTYPTLASMFIDKEWDITTGTGATLGAGGASLAVQWASIRATQASADGTAGGVANNATDDENADFTLQSDQTNSTIRTTFKEISLSHYGTEWDASIDTTPTTANGTALESISGSESDINLGTLTFTAISRTGITSFSPFGISKGLSGSLPISLTNFVAHVDRTSAELQWTTASENNGMAYMVEHRLMNGEWAVIGTVAAAGNSTTTQAYTHTARNLGYGLNEFRLKMVDKNGGYTYSTSVAVQVEMPDAMVLNPVYPNPFSQNATVEFAVAKAEHVSVGVYNVAGQKVTTLYEGTPEAATSVKVQLDASSLSSGTYFVRMVSGEKVKVQTVNIVK